MKQFIIKRTIPGAGSMTREELQAISKKSLAVIDILGKPYKWIQSFVTADMMYCIHETELEETIWEHSKCGDLPIDTVEEIQSVVDPTFAS